MPIGPMVLKKRANNTMRRRFSKGIYATSYGNAAYVSGPLSKTAVDLDLNERIPLAEVTSQRLRDVSPEDAIKASNAPRKGVW